MKAFQGWGGGEVGVAELVKPRMFLGETKESTIWTALVMVYLQYLLFEFAQTLLSNRRIGQNATLHERHFSVSKDDVNRKIDGNKYNTVPNTRKLHSLASAGQDGVVHFRHLSCYCLPCIRGNYEFCENKQYVDSFKKVNFGIALANSDEDTESTDSVGESSE